MVLMTDSRFDSCLQDGSQVAHGGLDAGMVSAQQHKDGEPSAKRMKPSDDHDLAAAAAAAAAAAVAGMPGLDPNDHAAAAAAAAAAATAISSSNLDYQDVLAKMGGEHQYDEGTAVMALKQLAHQTYQTAVAPDAQAGKDAAMGVIPGVPDASGQQAAPEDASAGMLDISTGYGAMLYPLVCRAVKETLNREMPSILVTFTSCVRAALTTSLPLPGSQALVNGLEQYMYEVGPMVDWVMVGIGMNYHKVVPCCRDYANGMVLSKEGLGILQCCVVGVWTRYP